MERAREISRTFNYSSAFPRACLNRARRRAAGEGVEIGPGGPVMSRNCRGPAEAGPRSSVLGRDLDYQVPPVQAAAAALPTGAVPAFLQRVTLAW